MPNYCATKDKNGRTLYWRVKPNGKRVRVRRDLVKKSMTLNTVSTCVVRKPTPRKTSKRPTRKRTTRKTSKRSTRKVSQRGPKKTVPPVAFLTDLPPEVATQILLHTSFKDLLAACASSKYMRSLCSDTFWKEKARQDFKKIPKSPRDADVKTWKQVYQKLTAEGVLHEVIAKYLYKRWGRFLKMSEQDILKKLEPIDINPKDYVFFDKKSQKQWEIFREVIPEWVGDEEKIPMKIRIQIMNLLTYLYVRDKGVSRASVHHKKIYEEVKKVLES